MRAETPQRSSSICAAERRARRNTKGAFDGDPCKEFYRLSTERHELSEPNVLLVSAIDELKKRNRFGGCAFDRSAPEPIRQADGCQRVLDGCPMRAVKSGRLVFGSVPISIVMATRPPMAASRSLPLRRFGPTLGACGSSSVTS